MFSKCGWKTGNLRTSKSILSFGVNRKPIQFTKKNHVSFLNFKIFYFVIFKHNFIMK